MVAGGATRPSSMSVVPDMVSGAPPAGFGRPCESVTPLTTKAPLTYWRYSPTAQLIGCEGSWKSTSMRNSSPALRRPPVLATVLQPLLPVGTLNPPGATSAYGHSTAALIP